MITKDYIIQTPDGIHARPATALVRLVKTVKADVHIRKGDKTVRMNSMLNILSLMAKGGDTVTVTIEGEEEEAAGKAIDSFFKEQINH
jgi:phosphocarrier protein HPr